MSIPPAHTTKHHAVLHYPLPSPPLRTAVTLTLHQTSTPASPTTGTTLWLGSQLLSAHLLASAATARPRGRARALELGAGTGLPALTLAALGWRVVATDLPVVVAGVLGRNIAANEGLCSGGGGSVEVAELDWFAVAAAAEGEAQGEGAYDLVVTADTVYEPSYVGALVETAWRSLRRGGTALVAVERREEEVIDGAMERARERGFLVTRVGEEVVRRGFVKAGCVWEERDWVGGEVWKWRKPGGREKS
ncbi:S-adenosyl-L-methionine-dependent methyltransferase [Geopyxis carbonaria]|nr:S-adenosyl-L-methionine-dependent methyltransferase [Geopyxis carbonaria]